MFESILSIFSHALLKKKTTDREILYHYFLLSFFFSIPRFSLARAAWKKEAMSAQDELIFR